MTRYVVSATFDTDRPLTDEERETLAMRLTVELEEPMTYESEPVEWVRLAGDYAVSVTPKRKVG